MAEVAALATTVCVAAPGEHEEPEEDVVLRADV